MKTSNWFKKNWLVITLMVLPVLITLILWDKIPDEVPVHWNLKGEVDGYATKAFGMFLLPATMLFLNIIFWIIPMIDPKKNIEAFRDTLYRLQVALNIFMFGLALLILGVSLGFELNVGTFVIYGVLFLLGIIGNYMGKMRPNYFVGIRTPWTLESEEVWTKTHRMAGNLWVGTAAVLMLMKSMMSNELFYYFFIPGIIVMAVIPMVYSYKLFKELKDQ